MSEKEYPKYAEWQEQGATAPAPAPPSMVPRRKVAVGAGLGVPFATLLTWGLMGAGIPVPPEALSAMGAVVTGLFSYFARDY